jgi:hypothetical protein
MFSKKENKEALVGGKGAAGDRGSEVSQTTNVCTDEQEEPEGAFEASVRHI